MRNLLEMRARRRQAGITGGMEPLYRRIQSGYGVYQAKGDIVEMLHGKVFALYMHFTDVGFNFENRATEAFPEVREAHTWWLSTNKKEITHSIGCHDFRPNSDYPEMLWLHNVYILYKTHGDDKKYKVNFSLFEEYLKFCARNSIVMNGVYIAPWDFDKVDAQWSEIEGLLDKYLGHRARVLVVHPA